MTQKDAKKMHFAVIDAEIITNYKKENKIHQASHVPRWTQIGAFGVIHAIEVVTLFGIKVIREHPVRFKAPLDPCNEVKFILFQVCTS